MISWRLAARLLRSARVSGFRLRQPGKGRREREVRGLRCELWGLGSVVWGQGFRGLGVKVLGLEF